MEKIISNGDEIGSVTHNGMGMCLKVKEQVLSDLAKNPHKKFVIIDPNSE